MLTLSPENILKRDKVTYDSSTANITAAFDLALPLQSAGCLCTSLLIIL